MALPEWTFIVPGDPNQNTGGYRYVRHLVTALNAAGQPARLASLDGRFPRPDTVAQQAMEFQLAALPDGSTVVLDGLAMSAMPDVLARHRHRLAMVGLVHHPLADEAGLSAEDQDWFFQAEKRALAVVGTVITTSRYTARRLRDFGVPGERIVTAEPAVDDAVFA
ncbi:MAG TPA: glycosyltransferase, partial [Marinobacter sp.]|nr:glycosyltransferase [Marinobacter sp.]